MEFFYGTALFSAIILLIGIWLFLKYLRYGSSRELFLNIFCYLQGRRSVWIRDPSLAHLILHSSASKGSGIERLISTQGFSPVLSLESVDGDQWVRMKRNFTILRSHLPRLSELASVTSSFVHKYLQTEDVLESSHLAEIIFHSLHKWIFDIEPEPHDTELVLAAVLEWRKELAIKAKGDMDIKLGAIRWIQGLIQNSKYYDVFGTKWEEPEYWSLFLQPLFISPIINITDIAVSVGSDVIKNEYLKGNCVWSEQLFINAVNFAHPFPILERWFPEGLTHSHEFGNDNKTNEGGYLIAPRTHVFLPMDEIGASLTKTVPKENEIGQNNLILPPRWTAFGAGKRVCGGQDIAHVLCEQIFGKLILDPKFKPSQRHLFSGRDNDLEETWSQSFFQLLLLLRILRKLFFKQITNIIR